MSMLMRTTRAGVLNVDVDMRVECQCACQRGDVGRTLR